MIQKYVEKENTYDIRSSKAFKLLVSIHASPAITRVENVAANTMTHDATVVANDDNIDANVVTHDAIVVTNNETISIN